MTDKIAVFVILFGLIGCNEIEDVVDPSEDCHTELTAAGVEFRVCAVESGNSYIETRYGDLDCATWRGRQDCERTAELYIGTVTQCMLDAQDDLLNGNDSRF